MWYLNRRTKINFRYLNKLYSSGLKQQFKDKSEVVDKLGGRIKAVDVKDIFKDVNRFLEDSGEESG